MLTSFFDILQGLPSDSLLSLGQYERLAGGRYKDNLKWYISHGEAKHTQTPRITWGLLNICFTLKQTVSIINIPFKLTVYVDTVGSRASRPLMFFRVRSRNVHLVFFHWSSYTFAVSIWILLLYGDTAWLTWRVLSPSNENYSKCLRWVVLTSFYNN